MTTPQRPGTVGRIPLGYREGTYAYDIRQTTVITVGTDVSTAAQDTLVTAGTLTVTVQGPPETTDVMGVVDSLVVLSRRDTAAVPRRLAAPISVDLRATIDTAPVVSSPDSTIIPSSCDSMEDAARAIARDIHIRIPPGAVIGHRWTDSTTALVCRGGIPMTATTTSTFELQNTQSRSDSAIVQIVRRSNLALSGSGLQGSRRITVAGDGTSEAVFTYDLRTGVYLGSVGQSTLRLRFDTIQQTEHVTQQSIAQVQLRPRS